MVLSMRIELDDTALVRPSNAASFLRSGSDGSTTMALSPLESSAAASARPTIPPPKMMTSARSMALVPNLMTPRRPRLTGDSSARHSTRTDWGWTMATAAARARKRDLGPHWRDALSASLKRFALRSWGALLVGIAIAGGIALATHSSTDPSFTTAAGGPPSNWLGSVGAYASDALLLLFGLGSVLFLPVIALAGIRMLRLQPSGRIGRGLTIAAVGAVLV